MIFVASLFFIFASEAWGSALCCKVIQPGGSYICYSTIPTQGCLSGISSPYPCEQTVGCPEYVIPMSGDKDKPTSMTIPVLQIPIPGLIFTTDESVLRTCIKCKDPAIDNPVDCPPGKCANWSYSIPWIGEYIAAFYKWFIGFLAILAVIMIMISGIRWLIAGSSSEKVSSARQGIVAAVSGLLLILIVHQVLAMINPELTILKPIVIGGIERIVENEELGFDGREVLIAPSGSRMACPLISPDPNSSCETGEIVKKAESFLGQNSGPCHCACYVSRVLKFANCGITTLYAGVNDLESWLQRNGWKKHDILTEENGDKEKAKKRVSEEIKPGDIVSMNGHIGISLGSGQIIDSGRIRGTENGCSRLAKSCPNVWHGLNYSDGKRLWAADAGGGSNCSSNQTIKKRANLFHYYFRKE